MPQIETEFALRLRDVPLLNIRFQFKRYRELLGNEKFLRQCKEKQPWIETPYAVWCGWAASLFTHILRETIVGLEAYTAGAVATEAMYRDKYTEKLAKGARDPFSLRGRGTADNVFNKLPGLLDPALALSKKAPDLWKEVSKFYRTVRNPLFHAYQVSDEEPECLKEALSLIAEIYRWIDDWHSLDEVIPGSSEAIRITESANNLSYTSAQEKTSLPIPDTSLQEVSGLVITSPKSLKVSAVTRQGVSAQIEMSAEAAENLLRYLAMAWKEGAWQLKTK